ncbi:uncharacterized protein LOC141604703 isoform X2 [Silene latifolia]
MAVKLNTSVFYGSLCHLHLNDWIPSPLQIIGVLKFIPSHITVVFDHIAKCNGSLWALIWVQSTSKVLLFGMGPQPLNV